MSRIPPPCDHTSVGVLIVDEHRRFLVFDHTTGRPGVAPVSGHVDANPTPELAACTETLEEAGLVIHVGRLIASGWRRNTCRRAPGPAGPGHTWWIFTATVRDAQPRPSPRETRNMRWVTEAELQRLAERTAAYARGEIPDAEWAAEPGIAPVWAAWLVQAGLAALPPEDLQKADELAAKPMPATQEQR